MSGLRELSGKGGRRRKGGSAVRQIPESRKNQGLLLIQSPRYGSGRHWFEVKPQPDAGHSQGIHLNPFHKQLCFSPVQFALLKEAIQHLQEG